MSAPMPTTREAMHGAGGSMVRPEKYGLTREESDALFRLVDGTSGDEEIEIQFVRAMLLGLRVFKQRQRKYGRENIAESGASGVRVRTADKLARLKQLYVAGKGAESTDESVQDTWLDVGNYGFIGLMVHMGTWPGAADE